MSPRCHRVSPPPVGDSSGTESHRRSTGEHESSTVPPHSLKMKAQSRATHGSEKQRVFSSPFVPKQERAINPIGTR